MSCWRRSWSSSLASPISRRLLARRYRRMTSIYTTTASPVGELLLVGDGQTLQGLYMQEGRKPKRVESSWSRDDDAFADVLGQLAAYFDGGRREFDVPL